MLLACGNCENPGHISSSGMPSNRIIFFFQTMRELSFNDLTVRCARITLSSWSISLRPGSRGSLFTSSANIHPMDHISIAVVYSFAPSKSSGALLYGIVLITCLQRDFYCHLWIRFHLPVPQCNDKLRHLAQRTAVLSCETKIGDFDLSSIVQQQIARL